MARRPSLLGTAAEWLRRILRVRFVRFGLVGASGIPVNLAVLHVGQTWLFAHVASGAIRLNASLGLAIFCATVNNFLWNRALTWRDRRPYVRTAHPVQFAQYALACWLGILLQFAFTNLFALWFHYLVANLVAIVLASVFNYLANDLWTFGGLRLRAQRRAEETSAGLKP